MYTCPTTTQTIMCRGPQGTTNNAYYILNKCVPYLGDAELAGYDNQLASYDLLTLPVRYLGPHHQRTPPPMLSYECVRETWGC